MVRRAKERSGALIRAVQRPRKEAVKLLPNSRSHLLPLYMQNKSVVSKLWEALSNEDLCQDIRYTLLGMERDDLSYLTDGIGVFFSCFFPVQMLVAVDARRKQKFFQKIDLRRNRG